MQPATDHLLATALLTAAAVDLHRLNGGRLDDGIINGSLCRRVRGLLESAAVPHVRIRNRYYVDRRHVALVAQMLGLRSSAAKHTTAA